MKKLLILLLLIPSLGYSATRNIVPRGTGEGWIGLSTKTWAGVYADQFFGTTGVFTSTITTPYLQGGGADFTAAVTGISLSEIEDLEADKTFTMANKTLTWNFTNPSGGMAWNFTGAAAGHSLDIIQSGGNPGADNHLLHIQASDEDPTTLHLVPGAAVSRSLLVHVYGDNPALPGRFTLYGSGDMAWGDGAAAADTNLYRDSADVLKTDDSLVVVGSVTANTYYGDGSNLTGVIKSTATGYYALRVATATYLATAPGACAAGQYISALTADGTKTCGTPSGAGDVVLSATQTFTGANTFTGSVTASSFTATGVVTLPLNYALPEVIVSTTMVSVSSATFNVTLSSANYALYFQGRAADHQVRIYFNGDVANNKYVAGFVHNSAGATGFTNSHPGTTGALSISGTSTEPDVSCQHTLNLSYPRSVFTLMTGTCSGSPGFSHITLGSRFPLTAPITSVTLVASGPFSGNFTILKIK